MDRRRLFTLTAIANLVIALTVFAVCCVAFVLFVRSVKHPLATYALTHHVGLIAWTHVKTLPGYGLLALGYTLVGYPLLVLCRPRRRLGALTWLALINVGLFVVSLGLAAHGNPSFLDVLSRLLSPRLPELDLYWIYSWRLIPLLTAATLALCAYAAVHYVRALGPAMWRAARRRRGLALSLASLVGAALGLRALPGCGPRVAAPAHPNIIILASDSLRADHLGAYGYRRPTSPAIDRLAREGIVFEQMHVATASTLESWTSLLTAQFPTTHGLRYMYPSRDRVARVSASADTLPRVLGRRGYHSTVSSDWAGNCFKLVDFGFSANHASDVQNLDTLIAEMALKAHALYPIYFNNRLGRVLYPELRQLTAFLNPGALVERLHDEIDTARRRGQPVFGVLFTSSTHLPYNAAFPYNLRFVDRRYRGPNRFKVDFDVDAYITGGFKAQLSAAQKQHIVDLYDGAVAEFDDAVAQVYRTLQTSGLLENTILIVTTDHGEDLYDQVGLTLGHGTNFFGGDQSTRIPFVMRLPKKRLAGTRVRQITRTVDVAPTLLELAGRAPVPSSYRGVSLTPAMGKPERVLDLPSFAETCYLFFPKRLPGVADGDLDRVAPSTQTLVVDPLFRNNLVLDERYHAPVLRTKDRMIRTPRWKLIHVPGTRGPIYRLYDMRADPRQERDRSSENLRVMGRLIRHLDAYWAGRSDLRWSADDD